MRVQNQHIITNRPLVLMALPWTQTILDTVGRTPYMEQSLTVLEAVKTCYNFLLHQKDSRTQPIPSDFTNVFPLHHPRGSQHNTITIIPQCIWDKGVPILLGMLLISSFSHPTATTVNLILICTLNLTGIYPLTQSLNIRRAVRCH